MKKITSLVALFLSFLIISLPVCFAETLSLTYDKNGNLVTGDGFYREYNSLNQLWRIRNGSSINNPVLEDYTYHPVEERILIKKKYNSSGALIETVYYVNENHVRIVNESGTFDTIYIKHEGQLIAEMRNDSTKIFHYPDHLGSATLVTDESGNEIERSSYTPYGLLLGGGTQSRYGYEGKEHKEGSGSIPTGELAYFSFEGLTEDNGYNGTANGTIKTTGKIGYGYEFDGSDDYIDFGTHMDIDSEDSFTYAAWIYTDGLNDDRGVIFGGDYRERDCFSLEKDGTIRLRLDESPLTSNGKITFGEWNHVVAVYTYDSGNGGTDSTVALYINGVLDKEESPAWDGGVFDSWTTGQRRAGYESAYNYYFDGIIDELGVWKRALSAEEVEELYSYGPSENGEVDFNFRMYKAEWGIFTQPDSLLPNVYDPQQLNRYEFERGNPFNQVDPDGHLAWYAAIPLTTVVLGGIYATVEFGKQLYAHVTRGESFSTDRIIQQGIIGAGIGFAASTVVCTFGLTGGAALAAKLGIGIIGASAMTDDASTMEDTEAVSSIEKDENEQEDTCPECDVKIKYDENLNPIIVTYDAQGNEKSRLYINGRMSSQSQKSCIDIFNRAYNTNIGGGTDTTNSGGDGDEE